VSDVYICRQTNGRKVIMIMMTIIIIIIIIIALMGINYKGSQGQTNRSVVL